MNFDDYIEELKGVVALPDMMSRSLVEFARGIKVLLEEEQQKPLPDNALIATLCDAGRLGYEYLDYVKRSFPHREELVLDRDHLTDTGTFQSDKYPWCPPGFVPLKLTDPAARDLLREYAKRRGQMDQAFRRDLLEALENVPEKQNAGYAPFATVEDLWAERQ